ncbi:uncharacterized protein LOC115582716 isoform X2 [Sparus aurata]|uniref:uncharacterized protein LOC115582716 isoform X2 n=1 Tax=Sparus aurata TaxID=8175 RepID=UPI0011C0E8B6|nr:uncharacterized protein LOC115582716 isoform X2 [Sparus aurata]
METQTENQRPENNNNGQLISVPHKDTIRLLEVYVKRSLSLNDGALGNKKGRKDKWVTMPNRQRRHSSDPSIHLMELPGSNKEVVGPFSAVEPPASVPVTLHEEKPPSPPEKPPKKPKNKKPSFWKNFVGFFSRKNSEEKDEDEDSRTEMQETVREEDVVTSCLPAATVTLQKKKSTRRKSIKKRLSMRGRSTTKLNKSVKDLNIADISRVEVVSVEATYSYYEKVSQELERIVHEVKEEDEELTDEQITNRIIALTKQQGDAIDDKLKDNPTLSGFFQRMTYSSFQKLADAYLETEVTPTHYPPTVPHTAPELIKLAFTYDFTAKVARLSRQNVGHITGLGNRYLEDRFEYKQACSDHPVSDSDS